MCLKRRLVWLAGRSVLIFAALLLGISYGLAEEYEIGPEDRLEVKFWQDPSLNTTVRVGLDGMISLDIVGQIQAAGKTTVQLEADIVRQISRLNKKISQAVVRVVEYNYQHVFVSGQVNVPGKMTFEEIPDLWTIINEAGGITPIGDLSRVTIIRGGDKAGQVEIVNVAEAIANGQLDKLPKIGRQDTIEIPRTPVGLPSGELAQQVKQKNLIYVLGAVNQPGPIQFEENTDILEALALAGGPSEVADLRNVSVVRKDGYYAQTLHFNLEQYAKTGATTRHIMRKEDTFFVPSKGRGFMDYLISSSTIVGAISSAVILIRELSN